MCAFPRLELLSPATLAYFSFTLKSRISLSLHSLVGFVVLHCLLASLRKRKLCLVPEKLYPNFLLHLSFVPFFSAFFLYVILNYGVFELRGFRSDQALVETSLSLQPLLISLIFLLWLRGFFFLCSVREKLWSEVWNLAGDFWLDFLGVLEIEWTEIRINAGARESYQCSYEHYLWCFAQRT